MEKNERVLGGVDERTYYDTVDVVRPSSKKESSSSFNHDRETNI